MTWSESLTQIWDYSPFRGKGLACMCECGTPLSLQPALMSSGHYINMASRLRMPLYSGSWPGGAILEPFWVPDHAGTKKLQIHHSVIKTLLGRGHPPFFQKWDPVWAPSWSLVLPLASDQDTINFFASEGLCLTSTKWPTYCVFTIRRFSTENHVESSDRRKSLKPKEKNSQVIGFSQSNAFSLQEWSSRARRENRQRIGFLQSTADSTSNG